MANNAGPNTQIPVDQPHIVSPGVQMREAGFFAQDGETAVRRGFVRDQLDATSAVGKRNGNRSDGAKWMTPKPLTDGGPWTNLRGRNRRL